MTGAEVTTVGNLAFGYLSTLQTVNLAKAETIGDRAFENSRLTSISLPEATTIGNQVFQDCISLQSVSLAKVTTINGAWFGNCYVLQTIIAPEVLAIPTACFQYNINTTLTTVDFRKATTIGNSAFQNCSNLTTVNFTAAQTIGEGAFGQCSALAAISLPAATSIGNAAFFRCFVLASLTLPAVPPTLGTGVFAQTGNDAGAGTTLSIHVGSGVSAYTAAAGWNVSATTAATGNTGKYGESHKAINIVN